MNKYLFYTLLFLCWSFTWCMGQAKGIVPLDIAANDHPLYFKQHKAFYWYGTSKGLYRYDGKQTKHFTIRDEETNILHDQYVSSPIFQDEQGLLWLTTYQALHSLDPEREVIKTFQLSEGQDTMATQYHIFHYDSLREELLIKADSLIFAFNTRDASYRLLHKPNWSTSLHASIAQDRIYFYGATWQQEIEVLEYVTGGIAQTQKIKLSSLVKEIAVASPDSLYLATDQGLQLLTFPLQEAKKRVKTVLKGNANSVVYDQVSERLYVNIAEQGIFCLSPKTHKILQYWNKEVDLSKSDDFITLTSDQKGNIFASYPNKKGVDLLPRWDNNAIKTTSLEKIEIADIAPLANNNLFILDNTGNAYQKDNESGIVSLLPALRNLRNVLANSQIGIGPDGAFSTQGVNGQLDFTNNGQVKSSRQIPFNYFRDVLVFESGEKIHISLKGLQITSSDGKSLPLSSELHDNDIFFSYLIKLSETRFLASYREVELWDIQRTESGWEVKSELRMPGETQTALARNDTIFAGTSAGMLTIVDNKIVATFNPISFDNLWVNALHFDPKGRLWMGTEQGLFCYIPASKSYRYFSQSDGLTEDRFIRTNVITTGANFTMATAHHLVTINPQIANQTAAHNKIYLSDIWIDGIRQKEHSLYAPAPLQLNYRRNAVAFLPGMIELLPSELSGFEYRLKGLEEDYTSSKSGEVIRYPSIPPGSYTFEFVGIDKNGRKTEAFRLPVSISPPFYQTLWFWTLCGVGIIATFYFINRHSINRETARQEAIQKKQAQQAAEKLARHRAVASEKKRIMMELHDDLGGTVSSLFYTLDGYLIDQESGFPFSPDLKLLKTMSSDALQQLREVMKSNIDSDIPLATFIHTLIEKARNTADNSKLNWKLEKDQQFPDRLLKNQQVHNALLIVKEGLNNIRKHAKASSFSLSIHLDDKQENITVTLTDDGIGIKKTSAGRRNDGTGNGLNNMHERAGELNGKLHISNSPTSGTSLQLSFPIY